MTPGTLQLSLIPLPFFHRCSQFCDAGFLTGKR